jgi:phage tail-like protein
MSGDTMDQATRYQFVRDRLQWDATLVGLEADRDGKLKLAALPGPAERAPVKLPPPWGVEPSGIAAGPCSAVFVADTADNKILFVDRTCAAQAWLPSATASPGGLNGLDHPRGLAVGSDGLWVADSGNRRVLRFAFPDLDLDLALSAPLQQPTGLAVDGHDRLYVLDRGLKRVLRFQPNGDPDFAFDAALAATGKLADPRWLTVGESSRLFVSDRTAKTVRCFDKNGAFLKDMAPPTGVWAPGALVAGKGRVFVAETGSGSITIFLEDGTWWCDLPSFTGPVTALTLTEAGDLLIKTGLDAAFMVFPVGQSCAVSGSAMAGPYDAGEKLEWFRATADAAVPRGTSIVLEVAQWQATAPPPGPTDWVRADALDTLLAALLPPGPPPAERRFLWLRATLSTLRPGTSPALHQLRAETPSEDYRDYLPEIYRRNDEPALFLFRLLSLVRTELGAIGGHINALPQLLSPDFAPASALPWLADWLGLELPRIATDPERRALIEKAVALYRKRGTPEGIRDFVEIYTGVRPSLVEAFEERGLWVLDVSSLLGFDTGLPASDPVGVVVPDPDDPLQGAAGCCATTIGSAVVGQSGPLDVSEFGEPLFLDTAHRFTVFVPAYRADEAALRAEVRRIIDAEKPAHTDYHLCLIEPDLRVGFQAQVGVDTIVGGPPPPLRLGSALLGIEANLPAASGAAVRVGQSASVGCTTVLG